MTELEALKEIVKRAGGQSALARAFGVNQPMVWRWLNHTGFLPAEHVLKAERLYGVSRHNLRPDIYPIERRRRAARQPVAAGARA